MASISMEIYEVLFQDIIRGTLIEAGISGPEAAGLVASQNTEYLFLLGEFGGVGVRKYENRWTIFVSAVAQLVSTLNDLRTVLTTTDCTVRL
jgi:uncharacterized protein YukE